MDMFINCVIVDSAVVFYPIVVVVLEQEATGVRETSNVIVVETRMTSSLDAVKSAVD